MQYREVDRIIQAVPASDGAGVRLNRSLGQNDGARVDPFLLLDEFGSDRPGDYLPGFPAHPHRGFETVTYMLEGQMLHEDHLGNRGELGPGGAQWMTAGRGIIHSEMPQQEEGRMRGFQLWVNLPAAEKMRPPRYQDITTDLIPQVTPVEGGRVRVVAGSFGGAEGPARDISVAPLYLDISMGGRETQIIPVEEGHAAFVYVLDGRFFAGSEATEMIAELVAFKRLETTGKEMIKTVHAHPTLSEAVMEAAAVAYGEAINI